MEASERVERVTPLELFFDLVFVFAITQVTTLLSADPTWAGLVRGLLVLAALWWAWAAYAWLTNTLNPEEGLVRLAMFVVMGAMLIVALAVPEAFGDARRHLRRRLPRGALDAHRALRARRARRPRSARRGAAHDCRRSTISGVLILVAGFIDGQ